MTKRILRAIELLNQIANNVPNVKVVGNYVGSRELRSFYQPLEWNNFPFWLVVSLPALANEDSADTPLWVWVNRDVGDEVIQGVNRERFKGLYDMDSNNKLIPIDLLQDKDGNRVVHDAAFQVHHILQQLQELMENQP